MSFPIVGVTFHKRPKDWTHDDREAAAVALSTLACELLKGEHLNTTEIQIDGALQKE